MLAVAAVGGLLHYHRLELTRRYLVGVVGWALLIELTAKLFTPNLFLIPIDIAGEFALLALVYQAALRSAAFSRWLPWLVGGLAASALVSGLARPGAVRFQPELQVLENILLLLLVVVYFRKLLNELTVKRLELDPVFWLSTGLFMYSLGSIQISLFSNYLLQRYSSHLNVAVWFVHALLVLILYSCYALALWMRPQK